MKKKKYLIPKIKIVVCNGPTLLADSDKTSGNAMEGYVWDPETGQYVPGSGSGYGGTGQPGQGGDAKVFFGEYMIFDI